MTDFDELIAKGRFQLFYPTSKGDILVDYPELRKVPSFMALTPQQMIFVWWYAARWSPARELQEDKDRIAYAMRKAWPMTPSDILKHYPEREWGAKVDAAIRDMMSYEPLPRVMMKVTCQRIIGKIKRVTEIDEPKFQDFKDKTEFFRATEAYLRAMKTGIDMLDSLLPYTEKGAFGVVEVYDNEPEEGEDRERLTYQASEQ